MKEYLCYPVIIDNQLYRNVYQYYYIQKTISIDERKKLLFELDDINDIIDFGKNNIKHITKDWTNIRNHIFIKAAKCVFIQHEDLMKLVKKYLDLNNSIDYYVYLTLQRYKKYNVFFYIDNNQNKILNINNLKWLVFLILNRIRELCFVKSIIYEQDELTNILKDFKNITKIDIINKKYKEIVKDKTEKIVVSLNLDKDKFNHIRELSIDHEIEVFDYSQLQLYTGRMSYKGDDKLDITVKAKLPFSPTWKLVNKYKKKNISEDEYKKEYHKMMKDSIQCFPEFWGDILLNNRKLTICCYCKPKDFCHRFLLKDYLVKIGAKYISEH